MYNLYMGCVPHVLRTTKFICKMITIEPQIISIGIDENSVYITVQDDIKEYNICFDNLHFLTWFGSEEIATIKENAIKKIQKR